MILQLQGDQIGERERERETPRRGTNKLEEKGTQRMGDMQIVSLTVKV